MCSFVLFIDGLNMGMRLVAAYIVDTLQKKYLRKYDLTFVSYFTRDTVLELMHEFVISAADSMDQDPGRKIYEHTDIQICCHRIDTTIVILVTDLEYPSRVSFRMMNQLHEDPTEKHLETILNQCQDARNVDALYAVQRQLDETLVIMHENVNKILQRGDDIDALVEKSERLSQTSKTFYKVARKHNRCCTLQ